MEPSYWKKYDQVFKHFSYKRVYEKVLSLAEDLGNPFFQEE